MRARPGSTGLSPRENRDIPPLDYDIVFRLKAAHPRLPIVLNGGIATRRGGARASAQARRRDDGPRRLSGAVAAAAGRSAAVRRAGAVRVAESGSAGAHPLHRARACARHAAAFHHAPSARPVPGGAGRARLPPASRDRRGQARRMRRGSGRGAGAGGGQAAPNWRTPPRPNVCPGRFHAARRPGSARSRCSSPP